jgi:predicted RNA binding protein YcfA (HicA-like mRNA interferase family)
LPKLPRVTGKDAVAALKRLGFQEVRQKGSHLTLSNPQSGAVCGVPVHAGETLAPKTLKRILEQARLSVETFVEAL